VFDEREQTITDRLLDPVRRVATGTAILGQAVRRQAARERDSLLGAFGIPAPPEALKTMAQWGGILLTMGTLLYYATKASKKKRRRR
jgi:hypothetical protein